MKVTLVVPAISRQGGGISEIVRLLARAMDERPDVDVEILTIHRGSLEEDIAAFAGLKVRAYRFFGPRTYYFSPGLLWAVLCGRPDLIHVHAIWGFHVFAVHLWHLLTGRPYVVTPHGMMDNWILQRSPRLKAGVSRLYQDRFLANASGFQINAETERHVVSAFVPGARITVVANQVAAPADSGERPPWWTPSLEGRKIFLFFGRIHNKKGILELLDAWDQVCAKDASFHNRSALIIAGWHDGLDEFEARLAAVAGRQGNVTMVGSQFGDAKWASYRAANFFMLPSKSEGQPMAVLEAWASGVPVVMTDACNLSQGFGAGAALRTGTATPEIALSLIEAAAMSEAQREAMSRAALRLVDEQFSMRVIGGKMAEFYARSAGKPVDRQPTVAAS